ncbi:response regulator transcription factor [Fontimonas sp. SYSU GA230001]|uniref:LuxR family transcriptional regulator n=1 Tax=Fontimonas sp. SYSU GA230001 TaxID=3142450 RepID=UPI0032B3D2D5
MSRHIVVLTDRIAGRWREAFDEVAVVGDPIAALTRTARDSLFWVLAADRTTIRSLRRARPDVPLVAMSLQPDAAESMAMFEAGASGYCHALAVPELLRQIDMVVRHGGLWVGPDLMARAAAATARLRADAPVAEDRLTELTPREREVAQQVAAGAANKEIARNLDISLRTVKAHMGAIFDKLGVRDRLQLVLALRQDGASH